MGLKIQKFLCIFIMTVLCFPIPCFADLKSSDVLVNSQWTLLTEYEIGNNTGNLQSICTTDTYIVCMINASNTEALPDTLIAFYKGGSDAEGNPVEPYSVAMKVTERDYEHGNGMTFNPDTREIIITGGKNLDPDNKGCVFVVDADTLKFKRKVKISDEWNVHAIDYIDTEDRYLIQKGGAGDYEFVEADADFTIIDEITDMVQMGHAGNANTFQDLCICGDDIITLPYHKNEQYNGNIQVYSRKEKKLLGEYQLAISSDSSIVEAESISELYPGSFVLGCAVRNPRRIALYGATLPMSYQILTSIDHGTITESAEGLDLGSEFTIEWQPEEGYETKALVVDGESMTVSYDMTSYTLYSITSDHSVEVECVKIPEFEVTSFAEHGSVDEGWAVKRGQDITLTFTPDEHYELDHVLVNGETVKADEEKGSVTITDVQEALEVQVIFKELPRHSVTVSVKNGKTSGTLVPVYEGEDLNLDFTPDRDYELGEIYVDGVKQETLPEGSTFVLRQVTKDHEVQLVFRWKYRKIFWLMSAGCVIFLAWYLFLVWKRKRKQKQKQIERNIWMEEMKEVRKESEEE